MTDIITIPKRRNKSKSGAAKIGRMERKPAHKRYNAERRWITNKERRIAKEAKRQARLHKEEKGEKL